MGFLRQSFPEMAESYQRLYPGAYAGPEYVSAVRGLIEMLQERHALKARVGKGPAPRAAEDPPQEAPEQSQFDW